MSEAAQTAALPPNYVPVSEWAIRYGFRESEIHHRIRAGILDGVELDGVWYVVRTLKTGPAPAQASSASLEGYNSNTNLLTDVKEVKGFLVKWLAPRYDELTLFIMSFSALVVFGLNKTLQSDFFQYVLRAQDIRITYLLFPLFIAGLALSLAHAMVPRKKSELERELMLFFAVFLQAPTGIVAGFVILQDSAGFFILFPVWNILSGIALLFFLRSDIINTSSITDGTHCRTQVAIAAIAVIAIILVCHYFLTLHWAITLSISIAVASSLSEAIDLMISPAKT
jgi:hypothetical protein